MKNILIAVSGPSGVGKGTIVKELLKKRSDLALSVSCATREPRKGEVHGKDYFFIAKEEFLARIDEGDFLEYDEHFGNYYGTPKSFVKEALKEKSVILEIDVVGALNAKKAFPECVLIMIVPPSKEELKKRLIGRNSESPREVEERLSRLEYELSKKDEYDYEVINGDLKLAVLQIESIIEKEKNK
ncbi:MAG: guanylate kinase [Clostridia bacterium]|nr:guanylate kinase [Clostridia bacterium]